MTENRVFRTFAEWKAEYDKSHEKKVYDIRDYGDPNKTLTIN